MTEIYGHKWVSSFGETDTDDTWALALHDMTGENLAQGLRACLSREDVWPPTLPEFRSLCKPKSYPYHEEAKALPTPTLTNEQKLEHIAKCRDALK